jgi:hypothetical protein
MKIPPLPTPVTKPAPPQVTSIAPLRQSIGGEVVVMGAGFTGATKVAIFDDAAGNEVLVRFELRSDSELSFKMPTLSKHCRHAAIIVLTPGGVTVTLPKLCSVAKPLIWNLLPDTRQVKTVEKQGQYENIWYVVGQPKILQGTHHPTHLTRKDGILAYVEPFAEAYTGQRGHNVLFVKDAAISTVPWRSVVYHEPFALIWPPVQESLEEMETRLIAVPAIRPSLLEELLEYKQPQ